MWGICVWLFILTTTDCTAGHLKKIIMDNLYLGYVGKVSSQFEFF